MARKRTQGQIRFDELERCYIDYPPELRDKAIALVNAVFGSGPPLRLKLCTKCKEKKPQTRNFFVCDAASPDGLANKCKSCMAIANREYRARKRMVSYG